MKVLIVSSEPLNPENLLSSCFELDQARALRNIGIDACIVAVYNDYTLVRVLRSLVMRVLNRKDTDSFLGTHNFLTLLMFLINSSIRILGVRRFPTYKYVINDIAVYETRVQYIKFWNMYQSLNLWKRAGRTAFKSYIADNGLPDIIHAHNRYMYAGALANSIYQESKIPYILTEHSSFYHRGLVKEKDISVLKSAIENSKHFITVSEFMGEEIKNRIGEFKKVPIVVPNMVGDVFTATKPNVNVNKKEEFTFINVASLVDIKDHETLLLAFKEVSRMRKNVRLYMVGYGPLDMELRKQARILGIDSHVVFCGILLPGQIVNLIDSCNAFVLSSIYETFGVVVIESLARGKPVITTSCKGPEALINDTNGLIVPIKSIKKLSEAMMFMIDNYERYDQLRIREEALEKYNSRTLADKLVKLYSSRLN